MRIDTTHRSSASGRYGAAGRTGSGGQFVPAGSSAPSRVASGVPLQAMTGIDSILALQSVDEPLSGRRKAVKRGSNMLDVLDEIKADLLVGSVSADRLDRLTGMLEEMRQQGFPGLDRLLDDIELRVRVELAKFGRFPAA